MEYGSIGSHYHCRDTGILSGSAISSLARCCDDIKQALRAHSYMAGGMSHSVGRLWEIHFGCGCFITLRNSKVQYVCECVCLCVTTSVGWLQLSIG